MIGAELTADTIAGQWRANRGSFPTGYGSRCLLLSLKNTTPPFAKLSPYSQPSNARNSSVIGRTRYAPPSAHAKAHARNPCRRFKRDLAADRRQGTRLGRRLLERRLGDGACFSLDFFYAPSLPIITRVLTITHRDEPPLQCCIPQNRKKLPAEPQPAGNAPPRSAIFPHQTHIGRKSTWQLLDE